MRSAGVGFRARRVVSGRCRRGIPMMSDTGSGRDSVEQLLESFLARWRAGERPSLEEYAARCPERADEIRELFPAMIEMEQLKPAVEVATGTLERPPTRPESTSRPEPPHPDRLGDFKILRVIPSPEGHPSRHQALEPAARRAGECLGHRLWAGQVD